MGSLNVHVTYKSGKGKKNVRVVGDVGGMVGGMTNAVYTDANGHANVSWSSNTGYLSTLYVGGKKYKGKFASGSTYSFSE